MTIKSRPYTRDDVLYHRRCRGDQYVSDYTAGRLSDNPEYVGPVGKVHDFRTMIMYSCKAGSWCVTKFDALEQMRPIETSTTRLTARRMCNAILGEPEPKSTFDGSGSEWVYSIEDFPEGRGALFSSKTAGDIAAEFGEVRMSYRTHERAPCVMIFVKGKLTVTEAGQSWPEVQARLFHRVVQEKRLRELAKDRTGLL